MADLTDAEKSRVLVLYQAARKRQERPEATIHVIRATGFAESAVRAVIEDFEFICEEGAA